MSTLLNDFEMKLVYVGRTVVTAISWFFIAAGLYLIALTGTFWQSWMLFLFIIGGSLLLNVYRFNKTLEINKGVVNTFQIKCRLLAMSRAVLAGMTYLCIALYDIWQSIFFALLTLGVIGIEVLIRHMETKKLQ